MSVVLFHGPGVRDRFSSPEGKGLRVAEARRLCMEAQFAGQAQWTLGPLDDATKDACDALLKLLEEHAENQSWTLWAVDLGLVPRTIRSRADEVLFLPGEEYSQETLDLAFAIARAALGKDLAFLYQKIFPLGEDQLASLVDALGQALAFLPGGSSVWPQVRPLCGTARPSPWQVLSALSLA